MKKLFTGIFQLVVLPIMIAIRNKALGIAAAAGLIGYYAGIFEGFPVWLIAIIIVLFFVLAHCFVLLLTPRTQLYVSSEPVDVEWSEL